MQSRRGPGECGTWWKEQENEDVNYSVEMASGDEREDPARRRRLGEEEAGDGKDCWRS